MSWTRTLPGRVPVSGGALACPGARGLSAGELPLGERKADAGGESRSRGGTGL